MGKINNQLGFGALEVVLVVIVLGVLCTVSAILWTNIQASENKKITPAEQAEKTETPEEVVIPEGFSAYTNAAAGFSIAFPDTWGEPKAPSNRSLKDVTAVGTTLDRLATDSPASVLSGSLRVTVTSKSTFSIIATQSGAVVKPVKEKTGYSWESANAAYAVKSAKTPSGITAFDFSWNHEGRTYGRWVFEAGTSFVTVELPYLWTPDGAAASPLSPEADLAAYTDLSKQVINTAKILQ